MSEKRKVNVWLRYVKKPRIHKKWQIIVHREGTFPHVEASYDTKKEAEKNLRILIKKIKNVYELYLSGERKFGFSKFN